jgi:hypothetical protein
VTAIFHPSPLTPFGSLLKAHGSYPPCSLLPARGHVLGSSWPRPGFVLGSSGPGISRKTGQNAHTHARADCPLPRGLPRKRNGTSINSTYHTHATRPPKPQEPHPDLQEHCPDMQEPRPHMRTFLPKWQPRRSKPRFSPRFPLSRETQRLFFKPKNTKSAEKTEPRLRASRTLGHQANTDTRSEKSACRSQRSRDLKTNFFPSTVLPHRSELRTKPHAYAPILPRLTPRGAFVSLDAVGTCSTHHGYAPRTTICAAVPGKRRAMNRQRQR